MKKKRIKQLGILVVLILAAVRFVFLPLSEQHEGTVAENQVLAKKIEKARALWENREELKTRLALVDQQLTDAGEIFPSVNPENAKGFQLKQQQVIEEIVKRTGIRIKTLSWLPITSPFFQRIPLKMVGEGSPEEFYEIIRQLEMRPEFIEIASLFLRKIGNKNMATGDVEISFYASDPKTMNTP